MSPLLKQAAALLCGGAGTFGVMALVLVMNQSQLDKQDGARQGEVAFAVEAPRPKKKPQQRKPRPKPKRSRAKPPPAPIVGASLAGMSFGLEALEGALGDDMDALLGDINSVVMTAETVDELPTPIHQPLPTPPQRAIARGIDGQVTISVLIGVDGRVQSIEVIDSRPPGVFDQAVLTAAKQWTFNPAMYQGAPVPLRVEYPIPFKFN